MNDILIVKCNVNIIPKFVRESIISQKEKGVVIIPNCCSMTTMSPGDTLIFKFKSTLSHEDAMEYREHILAQMEEGVVVIPVFMNFEIIRNDTEKHTSNTKPPLGIMHRNKWNEKRKEELAAAIDRYSEAGMRIPEEWVEEYNELVTKVED